MADLSDVQLHYVETSQEAADFVEWTKRQRLTMAVDTETTGLERNARIRLIQFGDDMDAWTLRWDRWKGPALEALELMKRARQPLTFHNAMYDVPKIERQTALDGGDGFKFDWGLLDDTMIMSRLAHPVGGHGLKALATKHVDRRSGSMQGVLSDAMTRNNWTWETVPYSYEGYTVYAGIDCILTARLLPELQKQQFTENLYRTEMSTLEACVSMSEIGMEVDVAYCIEQVELLKKELADIKQQGKDHHHFYAFGSDQMVVDKFASYGCFWDERTDTGRVALDSDVLERLAFAAPSAAARDLARLVLAHRTRVKLSSTYFKNMLSDADAELRVHPEINSLEAVTGRMSIKKPSMQNMPRGPRVRRGFVASPGHYFILADYAQIEQRILAHFCKDPGLIDAIASGDLHSTVAYLIFGGEVTPDRRQLAKSSGYAIIFGAGPEKFAHTAGVSVEVGQAFLNMYHQRFSQVKPFLQSVQAVARKRERAGEKAHVNSPAGRRLEMRKLDAHYTLCNYLIQGTAADIFKKAIERLWTTDMGQYMRLPVHDEAIFEVPNDVDPEEFKREAVRLMEDETYRVPMTVDATGPFRTWAGKYGEEG